MYNDFKTAVNDFRYLKKRKYADKSALKLVGDHYRLSKVERNCLMRGVVSGEVSVLRQKKLVPPEAVKAADLGIDWYNVLITIESYLKGNLLFLADDGILRDAAAIHGSYRQSWVTGRAIKIIIETVLALQPARIDIVMDSPISHSKKMADELAQILTAKQKTPFAIILAHSADFKLKKYAGVVASSDSIIIDSAQRIFDLARYCLFSRFTFQPKNIEAITFKE